MQRCRGREGDPVRPKGGRSAAAGANITRPQAGKVRADAPCDTRRAGYSQLKRLLPRYRKKGSTRVQGESVSFEKGNTLTAAGADVRAQAQGKTALFPQCAGSVTSDQGAGPPSHPMPRAGQATCRPRRAAAAIQGRKKEDEEQKRIAAGQGKNAKKTA